VIRLGMRASRPLHVRSIGRTVGLVCQVVEPGLRRFWLEFDLRSAQARSEPGAEGSAGQPPTWALVSGVGVTGTDLNECFDVVQKRIFGQTLMPAVLKVVQDIDVSTLDQDQVLPNIEPPVWRGIWFPPGFAEPPMT
jgi:hypothetical protein